jgi:hypothetical protein
MAMKWKFKQWWPTISPILTKQIKLSLIADTLRDTTDLVVSSQTCIKRS